MRFRLGNILALAAIVTAAACNNTTDGSSVTSPTVPATTKDTFSATLTVNGAVTHQFSTAQRGTVTATLTDVNDGTDNPPVIGVSLGTWNGTTCQILLANDQTAKGAGVLGTVSGVGNLCVRVYDVGKLTKPVTYTVDVTHP